MFGQGAVRVEHNPGRGVDRQVMSLHFSAQTAICSIFLNIYLHFSAKAAIFPNVKKDILDLTTEIINNDRIFVNLTVECPGSSDGTARFWGADSVTSPKSGKVRIELFSLRVLRLID